MKKNLFSRLHPSWRELDEFVASRNRAGKLVSAMDLDVHIQGEGSEQKIAKSAVILVFLILLYFRTVFKPKFFYSVSNYSSSFLWKTVGKYM